MKRYVGAYGVLVEAGALLLIRKSRGPYTGTLDLPGGGLEPGETPAEAVVRELAEETGLPVRVTGLLPPFSTVAGGQHHLGFLYRVERIGEAPLRTGADGQDSAGARWVPLDKLREEALSPLVEHVLAVHSLEAGWEGGSGTGGAADGPADSEALLRSENPLVALRSLSEERRLRAGVQHTPAEIAQQPALWRQTAALVAQSAPELRQYMEQAGARLLFSGAGTSHFIGLALEGLFRRRGIDATAVPSTEAVIDPGDALPPGRFGLVSFARSGNSPEGNAVFRIAARRGVPQLVITCNREGELYRLAGAEPGAVRLLLPEQANDRGLAMTSSYSSMVVAGQGLAMLDDLAGWQAQVERLAEAAERVLERAPGPLAQIALMRPARTLFLGTGTLLGAAVESHLKVQELTSGQVVAKAESFLGLRHGPMAMVDTQTLVVAYLSADPHRRRYELDLLAELRAKRLGAATVAVTGSGSDLAGLADVLLETGADVQDDLLPPVCVAAAQMLALFLSLACGLKPDQPSAGVINRVVQGVRIYEE